MTSRNLWSRYDRQFVGITRYNASSYMAKTYRVIQIKLNHSKKMSIWSVTYQNSVFKRYHSDEHFAEFIPTRWRQKSTGIDMEQNSVTVTLCIFSTERVVVFVAVAAECTVLNGSVNRCRQTNWLTEMHSVLRMRAKCWKKLTKSRRQRQTS